MTPEGDPERAWRPMRPEDVPAVIDLAAVVHPTFPERPAVFLDRIALCPEGALVADRPDVRAGLAAYALAHPASRHAPPRLDTVLGRLPADADALHVHDLAVDPACRGRGLAEAAVRRLLRLADARFAAATLVSVHGTPPFWERFGFRPRPDLLAPGRLATYGTDAVFMLRERPSAGAPRDRPGPGG